MDPAERFASVVGPGGSEVRLDEGALCIAALARPGLDIDAWCRRLDDLAAEADGPRFGDVWHVLFVRHGFRGDAENYGDPQNSFLDAVLTRERGIPITLSVVVIEVARRLGVAVHGVGMPGHFLVQPDGVNDEWIDPFGRGARLEFADCARIVDRIYAGSRRLDRSDLAPTPPPLILARILANLEQGPLGRDPVHLAWMLRLHLMIPDLPAGEQERLARRLAHYRARWN